MSLRIGIVISLGFFWSVTGVLAQTAPSRGTTGVQRAGGPDQPIQPQTPTLQRRSGDPPPAPAPATQAKLAAKPAAQPAVAQPAAPQPANAPFQLTQQQEAEVDRVLKLWEQYSGGVKNFDCKFKRWVYDPVFGPVDKPAFEDLGTLTFEAPDRAKYEVEGSRAEKWICDGKSIFEYNFQKKQMVEHKLPPEYQGKAIANGPLPFVFGAKADQLKQRYFVRIITPREKQGQETWLQVYPRYQQDAANFQRAELILANQNMTPTALSLYEPNEKNHTTYAFYDTVINDPLRILKNPFSATTPLGWQKVVEESPTAETARPPAAGARK
jgi:TIGR03009 family protein